MFLNAELIHALPPSDRRCFNRKEMASYVGVSAPTFDKLVASGRLPKPIRYEGRKVWDIRAVDRALDAQSQIDSSTSAELVSPLDAWRRANGKG